MSEQMDDRTRLLKRHLEQLELFESMVADVERGLRQEPLYVKRVDGHATGTVARRGTTPEGTTVFGIDTDMSGNHDFTMPIEAWAAGWRID